jgi:hypothetical protein
VDWNEPHVCCADYTCVWKYLFTAVDSIDKRIFLIVNVEN